MNITKTTVQELINEQFPEWKNLEIKPVRFSGHDNRTFHLGKEMIIRLPSSKEYTLQIEKEAVFLPVLSQYLTLPIPFPIAQGKPNKNYPFIWSINRYIKGTSLNQLNTIDKKSLAKEISNFLKELQHIPTQSAPEPGLHNFFRGAHPEIYHHEVQKSLHINDDLPIDKLKDIWGNALCSRWQQKPVWIHGDVAPGNLLIKKNHLCGVIDFGSMSIGDPACDYAMAWSFFDKESRKIFLNDIDVDTIYRAKGWALWKALITYEDEDFVVREIARYTIQELINEL